MLTFGQFFCNVVSALASVLPSTPPDLKLAVLAEQAANLVPFIGSQLILEVAQDISLVLSLVVPYKLYKILPSKF